MGFKNWLTKPRLSDEEWRKQMAFVGKGVVTVGAAVWALSVGTEFLEKRAMVLGASGMPIADTNWSAEVNLSSARSGYCRVNGQYQITNTGDLVFEVEQVLIEFHRIDPNPVIAEWEGNIFDAQIRSINDTYVTSETLVVAPIRVFEILHSGDIIQTSFVIDFAIPSDVKQDERFVIFAKGIGGLPETDSGLVSWLRSIGLLGNDYARFGQNDLRISTKTFQVFEGGCTSKYGLEDEGKGDLIVRSIADPGR